FFSFGIKQRKYVLNRDGSVEEHSYIYVTFVLDERICDGYYFASTLKYMKRFLREPWKLDTPPEVVRRDID
ncbi:MAG TPA: 2-oxo acid dehydrogenase subunit E2, partial [Bacillota bacterium]|nr:2-oxo acid dehydrogenase subunit E2 [Bacillota bacterium]